MIAPAARQRWHELATTLRPFIARRVRAPSDVDDVLQDVFVRLQRGLSQLHDEERFGPWVYQVARSAISEHARVAARHPVADPSELGDEPAPTVDEPAAAEELAGCVAPFIAMLDSPYREALTLTELQGLTQREAAAMLGLSVSGMKSRVQRGRVRLREAIEACCDVAVDARGQIVSYQVRSDGRLPTGLATATFVPTCCPPTSRAPARLWRSPACWRRADVEDATRWTARWTAAELAELAEVSARLSGRPPASIRRDDLPDDGALAAATRRWRHALDRGLGFVLVRGLDVDAWAPDQLATAYVVLGRYLGELVPQNLRGELITHVRDTGADPTSPATRLYTTRAEQDFHTDGADLIGLLCRRGARAGGASRIVSSGAVVEELARRHPSLYPVLFEDFPWRYQEEGTPPFVLRRPICTAPSTTAHGARLNTFFIPWYIRRSQELPDAPRLTEAQAEAIAALERIANDPAFYLDMDFDPGDLQWLKNAAILHKRTAYEDHAEPDRKRHLLRLWLRAADFADGDDQLRAGVTPAIAR